MPPHTNTSKSAAAHCSRKKTDPPQNPQVHAADPSLCFIA
jgi:hypothetical protein